MHKTILALSLMIGFISCKERPVDTKEEGLEKPIKSDIKTQMDLRLLSKHEISSGFLYSYKLGSDTIYVMEGKSSSYPVSLQVK